MEIKEGITFCDFDFSENKQKQLVYFIYLLLYPCRFEWNSQKIIFQLKEKKYSQS